MTKNKDITLNSEDSHDGRSESPQDIFDTGEAVVPFFGTFEDFEELERVITESLKLIKNSTNVRTMVLETWISLDFILRGFVLGAFGLGTFITEDFDPRYNLLPQRFGSLIQIVRDLTKWQTVLHDRDKDKAPDLSEITFTGSSSFWRRLMEKYPDVWPKINEVETEILLGKFPERASEIKKRYSAAPKPDLMVRGTGRVPKNWLMIAQKLDEEWCNKATQLNKVRNMAAHSYKPERILKTLGLHGRNSLELVREYCLGLFTDLLGTKANV